MSVSSQSGVFGFKRQSAAGTPATGPYNSQASAHDEVQQVVITYVTPPTGGTFTLTYSGQTTSGIAYNASAATVQSALVALSNIDSGDVSVAGNAGGPWTVTFTGALGSADLSSMSGNGGSLTGGSGINIVVLTTQQGNAAAATAWHWLPALNVAFQPNQMVQTIPPEVGGSLWARGSYKGGVFGGGQVTMVPRGGLGLAELLYAFCGGTITNTETEATYAAGSANKLTGDGSNGLDDGLFKYRFIPDRLPGSELPWYTFVRNVGGKFVEQFTDGHLGSFSFDLTASNILQIDASFVSRTFETIAKGSGSTSVGAQVAGNGIPFQMVDAVVMLDTNDAGTVGAVGQNTAYNPTRLTIGFNNELTQNEFVVGSFYLQDITNLARSAQISYGLYLRDAEIYNRVYNHGYGAADGSSGSSWSSDIWKGKLNVQLTGGYIGSSSERYQIMIDIPEMDYQAAPVSLAGNNLVEYQLTTNVVLSQNTLVNPFTIEYITDEDIS